MAELPKPEVYEIPEDEFEHLQRDRDAVISTGLTSGDGAVELELYYHKDAVGKEVTYVVPCGEEFNAMPWKFRGHVTPEQARDEYLAEIFKDV